MHPQSSYSCRTAEQYVRSMLATLGYDSFRVLHALCPINLIAWKDRNQILFVQVRLKRSFKDTRAFQENIKELCQFVREGRYPGEIQLWMKTGKVWIRYAISSYGAMPISWGRADDS
ncbi:MAG TPA: hypothetical protein VN372_03425 [Methanospirillum sp.]|nr:hypothetical protein [Methanospirillum sp.]